MSFVDDASFRYLKSGSESSGGSIQFTTLTPEEQQKQFPEETVKMSGPYPVMVTITSTMKHKILLTIRRVTLSGIDLAQDPIPLPTVGDVRSVDRSLIGK
jgi:hypothetical protein